MKCYELQVVIYVAFLRNNLSMASIIWYDNFSDLLLLQAQHQFLPSRRHALVLTVDEIFRFTICYFSNFDKKATD